MLFNIVHVESLSFAFGSILCLFLFTLKVFTLTDRKVLVSIGIVLLMSLIGITVLIKTQNQRFVLVVELLFFITIWFVALLLIRIGKMKKHAHSKSKEEFAELLNGFKTGIVVADNQKEVIAVNSKAKELLDFHGNGYSSKNINTLLENEYQDPYLWKHENDVQHGTMHQVTKHLRHDHSSVRIDKHTFTWDDDEYKMLLLQDISVEIQLSKELQWQKDFNKLFIETIPSIVLKIDDSGRIHYMNDFGKTFLGITEDMADKNWFEYLPEYFKPEAMKFFASTKHASSNFITPLKNHHGQEYFIKWRSAGIKNLSDSGHTYIFIGEDITDARTKKKVTDEQLEKVIKLNEELELKLAQRTKEVKELSQTLENQLKERDEIENDLLNSQRLYNTLTQNFPNGIIGVLNRELRYVLAGGGELERLGLKADFLFGRKVFEIYPDFERRYEDTLKKAFSGEKISLDVELSGSVYNIIAVALPDMQSDRITEILVVISNITHGRKLEEDLHRAIEQEKELVELKSRFVTMASHEFRTPLGTILSSVFLLERYNDPGYEEKRTVHVNRIKKTINNLTELLNDYLSLSKLDEGKINVTLKQTNIVDTVCEIIKEMNCLKKADQRIEYTARGMTKMVVIDSHLLHNILVNLISNAIKYSSDNMTINVVTEVNNNDLRIYVIDQGSGILEEDQPFIFERFFRSKSATNINGTGLGLHIVKKYVELMNGSIDFTSAQNGTTFRILIPVS